MGPKNNPLKRTICNKGLKLGSGYGYGGTGNFPGKCDIPDLRVPGKIATGIRTYLPILITLSFSLFLSLCLRRGMKPLLANENADSSQILKFDI